jgi:hypothetical protein
MHLVNNYLEIMVYAKRQEFLSPNLTIYPRVFFFINDNGSNPYTLAQPSCLTSRYPKAPIPDTHKFDQTVNKRFYEPVKVGLRF